MFTFYSIHHKHSELSFFIVLEFLEEILICSVNKPLSFDHCLEDKNIRTCVLYVHSSEIVDNHKYTCE